MSCLNFSFDDRKLVQAIAFFSMRGINDLTKMKVAKLLFYADKRHLLEYGRPILGDTYYCMEHGPVPSASLNEMDDAVQPEQEVLPAEESLLTSVLTIDCSGRYPSFRLKNETLFDSSVFSRSDVQVLEDVCKEYGRLTAHQLRNLSHEEPAWIVANERRRPGSRVEMPYEEFFDESHKDVLAMALHDQTEASALDQFIYSVAS